MGTFDEGQEVQNRSRPEMIGRQAKPEFSIEDTILGTPIRVILTGTKTIVMEKITE